MIRRRLAVVAAAISVIALGRAQRAVATALATVILSAGIVLATIPADGVIDSCYTKSGGNLRVIDSATTSCGKNETPLSWNVTGPKGDKGDQGETGPQGPAGPEGPAGSAVRIDAIPARFLGDEAELTPLLEMNLDQGEYAFIATVQLEAFWPDNDAGNTWAAFYCELAGGNTLIGRSQEILAVGNTGNIRTIVTVIGSRSVASDGERIVVRCNVLGFAGRQLGTALGGQLMTIKVGGSLL